MSHEAEQPVSSAELPRLVPAALRFSGRIKVAPEDFRVEEIPAYLPTGTGEHLFLWIEKRDVASDHLLGHLARSLQIKRDDIGMAGLKDRWAVTRQWVSVPAEVESRVDGISTDAIQVLDCKRHENKLRTGHLRGNRFQIRVREIGEEGLSRARQIAEQVRQQGVPNYFGEQRFGRDGSTLELGRDLLLGVVDPRDIPFKKRKFLTRLALSAAQSSLFNTVLAERLADGLLHTVQSGDIMQVCASGGLFLTDDPATEQARFEQREIVMTGPLFGPKMKQPTGDVAVREQAALDAAGLSRDVFQRHKKLTPGARRPLLIWPHELTVDEDADGLLLSFELPSGSYATIVLDEFLKNEA